MIKKLLAAAAIVSSLGNFSAYAQDIKTPSMLPDASNATLASFGNLLKAATGSSTALPSGLTLPQPLLGVSSNAATIGISGVGGGTVISFTGNSGNVVGAGPYTDTLVGLGAGANLPTSDYLTTAVGWHALYANTLTNTESTAIGWNSQGNSVTGSQNTTLGINTLGTCTNCTHDILIGTDSVRNGLGSYEIGIGVTTLINDSAGFNIAIGDATLQSNLSNTGIFNIAIGWQTFTGTALTTGQRNIVIGAAIAPNATSATDNIFIGHQVAGSTTASFQNTVIGSQAAKTLNGNGVDTIVGFNAGAKITTAQQSLLLGAAVGGTNFATGSGVILIGSGKRSVDTPASGTSDYLNIENWLTVTGIGTPSSSVPTIHGLPVFPDLTTGTPASSACFDSSGNLIKKTTTGSCV